MPVPHINVNNCLILESKNYLSFVPPHFQVYFINSKRRFFVYFKQHKDMIETMRILNDQGKRYYQRASLLPDRQEYQQHVYHCNFKFKRSDLRKALHPQTPYNEPRVHFDKYDKMKAKMEFKNSDSFNSKSSAMEEQNKRPGQAEIASQLCVAPNTPDNWFGDTKIKHPEVKAILQNRALIRRIFLSVQ